MPFAFIIIGSELNLYFHNIIGSKSRSKEINSFWNFLNEIKKKYPNAKVSSSFYYEHIKTYNYWSTLGRERLSSLDFLSFSSFPLHLGWKNFKKFDPMFYLLPTLLKNHDFNYYDDIPTNLTNYAPVYIIDFGYPKEELDKHGQTNFIKSIKKNHHLHCVSLTLTNPALATDDYFRSLPLWDSNLNLTEAGSLFFH